MNRKTIAVVVLIAVVATGSLVFAQQKEAPKPADPRIDRILEQNEKILKNQEDILRQLEDVKTQVSALRRRSS